MKTAVLPEAILEERVIPVARGLSADTAVSLATALREGGLHVIEVTVEDANAIGAISSLTGSGSVVGAGTVTSIGLAAAAVDAGATFLVSPHSDPALNEWALSRGVPMIPGGLTPTEVLAAWRSGVVAVKVFPVSLGGPELIRGLRGPFPDIPLIPTGGITALDAADFLAAGAVAVGVGGWLTGHTDPALIVERAASLLEAIQLV
ncbi:MAG: bifunctional 4-hydroxy-2-oxoglutarate aldolase/2-dehydro-3-deoxy-phosphogluconate aldolase [Actinomycetota bacterium]|nr:bifunctional 4-hydroxy-2-oxoglutarate aldolase/2-dehydro-3-deoxy-phosphogluconate aldolase [Actinomycetota bacterium]